MSRPLPALAAAALLLLAPLGGAPAARADEEPPRYDQVVLTTGKVFEGTILLEDRDRVVLTLASEGGGSGQMTFPRHLVREIRRGSERVPCVLGEGTVRENWYLLRAGARSVGVRRTALRRARVGGAPGWRLEEGTTWFPRGRHVPGTRVDRVETVDLAFLPASLDYREVGDASPDPAGPRRYERFVVGKVADGTFTARVSLSGQTSEASLLLPPRTRGRLGAREDLLRRRTAGIEPVAFLEPATQRLLTVRAGYTVLDQPDGQGGRYDEFVWEEEGLRLTTRYGPEGPVSEEVADGVVAVPVSEAQAKAALAEVSAEAEGAPPPGGALEVVLPDAGVAFRVPHAAWKVEKATASPTDAGPRVLARAANPLHVADLRIEWDPDGALAAPGAEEAQARLLQRLRAVCPDLAVVDARAPVPSFGAAWRLGLRGTLRGEVVRTIAVVLDRAPARITVLLACPEVAWEEGRGGLEEIVASLRTL